MLFVRPSRLQPYVAQLAGQLAEHGLTAVCGPLVGGAFVALTVAQELDVEFCYSSFTGTAYEIRSGVAPMLRGQRVAVVDDAVNAGSAVLSTVAALEAAGARLAAVGALVALDSAVHKIGASTGVPVEHLAALPATLWAVVDCPLCSTGTPLDPPPS